MSTPSSTPSGRFSRLLLLALLYVAQALPLGFFVIAMPAILRERGVSLEQIGVLGALAMPFLLKFLWAPFIDRFGRYRSWLIWLQVSAVATVAAIAMLDPVADWQALLGLGTLFMLLAATQDVATDGLAVRLLWRDGEGREDRGLGNAIQVGGYYLGQILGGGLVLILVGRFGWTAALAVMALLLALPLPLVATLREPEARLPAAGGEEVRPSIGFSTLAAFFRRPGILSFVVVLLVWRLGETMTQWMVNPMLVDRGFSLERIGVLLGMLGSAGSLAGAFFGGRLIARLGRHRSLAATGSLLVPAMAAYLLPALGHGGLPLLYAVVIASAFAGGASTAALYTAAMDASAYDTAGTDFTIQQSLAAVGPMIAAGVSGLSAGLLGYPGHFALAAGVQLLVVAGLLLSPPLRRGLAQRAEARDLPPLPAARTAPAAG